MLQQKALLAKIPREEPWLSLALWMVIVAVRGVCTSVCVYLCIWRGVSTVSFGAYSGTVQLTPSSAVQ